MLKTQQKSKALEAFLLALLIAAISFIPYIILNRGYFTFFGDFNVQQLPFYRMAHDAVRQGNLLWNWNTDLGANFLASYSFYLIGSPFFWLTIPFPSEAVPYLIAPLLMLKMACASLTGYLYIQRFVADKSYAVVGGLLYAFSGFMTFNIFFNHFHEVAVFFPLLLIGLEELVIHNRRGVFALAVALNALVNYWFFIGEVVFVLFYFVLRCLSPQWKMTVGKFLLVALEAVLGMGLSMFLFLPSVLAIMGNPRTTADNLWSGWQFWLYTHEQRPPAILQSFFFPPELPSRPNFFPDHGAKWSSLSGWLPLVGMAGVIAYLCEKKRDWLKKAILLFLFIALVPGLNSLFILLNNSYYARWFYMPILLLCVATVSALESASDESLRRGARWNLGIVLGVTLAIGLTPQKVEGEWRIGLYKYADRFWAYCAIALVCAGVVYAIVRWLRHTESYRKTVLFAVCSLCVIFNIIFLAMGTTTDGDRSFIVETAIEGKGKVSLPQEPFARADFYECLENLGMFWQMPNIQTFHSIVPVSIMEFYPSVGVKRDVSSKPEAKYYALRALLSVRWLFIQEGNEQQEPMPGFRYYDNQLGFNIYENENFIPMGFCYDYYIPRETFEAAYTDDRARLLVKAILLEEETIAKYPDLLPEMHYENDGSLTQEDFFENAARRREQACSRFAVDNRGFSATIDLPQENLVFFSVPYEEGWSATVNGEPADIERVNNGFMAVYCPAGQSEIRFDYMTYGLPAGAVVSAVALGLLGLYLLFCWLWRRRHPLPPVGPEEPGPQGGPEGKPLPDRAAGKGAASLGELFFKPLPGEQPPGEPGLSGTAGGNRPSAPAPLPQGLERPTPPAGAVRRGPTAPPREAGAPSAKGGASLPAPGQTQSPAQGWSRPTTAPPAQAEAPLAGEKPPAPPAPRGRASAADPGLAAAPEASPGSGETQAPKPVEKSIFSDYFID